MDKLSKEDVRFVALVGLELRSRFTRRETTAAEVAKAVGHGEATLSKWFSGRRKFPLYVLRQICDVIGEDPGVIVDGAWTTLHEEIAAGTVPTPKWWDEESADSDEVDDTDVDGDEVESEEKSKSKSKKKGSRKKHRKG